jgi:hypothetical protein
MNNTYSPRNAQEATIEEILYSNGYEKNEIQFHGDDGKRYLRINYWERLSPSEQAQLDTLVVEESIDDSDTITLFLYIIK